MTLGLGLGLTKSINVSSWGLSPITVPNFSFESPAQSAGASSITIDSWSVLFGSCGCVNLTGQSKITPDSIAGSQVAYVSGFFGQIAVTLAELAVAGTYRVTGSIGRRNDATIHPVREVGIGVGATQNLPLPASGAWSNFSLDMATDPGDVGSPIVLYFSGVGSNSTFLLDNISLTKL